MGGIYPSRRQAQSMLALQAQPHTYPDPPIGDPPPLIWRSEKREGEWHVVGRTLEELKALAHA